MPDQCFNLDKAFKRMKERSYPKLYWAIDLHDVIIEGKFSKWNEGRAFYPDAHEVLKFLSDHNQMVIILYSASQRDSLDDIIKWLLEHGIKVDYVNDNPDMPTGHLCDFSKKFAFDILLEDKAGFVGETDWTIIKDKLKELKLWT